MRLVTRSLSIAGIGTLISLSVWVGQRLLPESAPVARGAAYAQSKGCIACHSDPNYAPATSGDGECSNMNEVEGHPEYDTVCTDVLAYFEAVRLSRSFERRATTDADNSLIAGERLARKYHCFQCHGLLGQGGFKNAKSLKGYVPGYFGADFKALTRDADRESVREWLLHGVDPAISDQPILGRIARFFFDRQAVSMPSFKSLDPGEIDTLVDYVIALHRFGPMTAASVRSYGERSQLPTVH